MATNGKLPASSLGFIKGTSRQVLLALVPQTDALRAAFERKFHNPLTITGGYRSYASQVSIFRDRYTTTVTGIDPRWWNGTLYWRRPGTAAAAVPGTSNHGWGQAIDFGAGVNRSLTSPEYVWMRAHAPAYGWTHPLWARQAMTLEPWHWEAKATPVNLPGDDNDVDIPLPDLDLPDDLETIPVALSDDILARLSTLRTTQVGHTSTLAALRADVLGMVDFLPVVGNRATVAKNHAMKASANTDAIIEALGEIGVDVAALRARSDALYAALAASDAQTRP